MTSYQKLNSITSAGGDVDNDSVVTDTSQLLFNNDSIADQIAKNIALDVGSRWQNFNCNHRVEKHKTDSYRKGPAPIEEAEALKKSVTKATYGTLDSDVEDLEFEDVRKNGAVVDEKNPYNKVKQKN